MSRNRLCAVLSALVFGAFACGGEAARDLTVQAEAHDSPLDSAIGPIQLIEEGGVVIRSAKELETLSRREDKDCTTELAKLLKVDSIDWNKQMVIAVRGKLGTKLDRVHFESLKAEDKTLSVTWKLKQRPPHAGPGNPLAVILVERFDGEVKFIEEGRR